MEFKTYGLALFSGLGLAVLVLGLLLPPVPAYMQVNPPQVQVIDPYGVADERLWYFSGMGLFRNGVFNPQPDHPWIAEGKLARQNDAHNVVIREGIGLFGYYAGPQVTIIDVHALSDPLLARLPAKRWVNWQIGHFERAIPDGYVDTNKVDRVTVSDPGLREFDQKLFIITRGNLFSWERLVEIWKMNTGQYNHLIDVDRYRYPTRVFTTLDRLGQAKAAGTAWDAPGNTVFGDNGAEIDLQSKPLAGKMEVSLDANDNYMLVFLNQQKELASLIIPASSSTESGLAVYTRDVPVQALNGACTRMRILPVRTNGSLSLKLIRGDGKYSIGHLVFK